MWHSRSESVPLSTKECGTFRPRVCHFLPESVPLSARECATFRLRVGHFPSDSGALSISNQGFLRLRKPPPASQTVASFGTKRCLAGGRPRRAARRKWTRGPVGQVFQPAGSPGFPGRGSFWGLEPPGTGRLESLLYGAVRRNADLPSAWGGRTRQAGHRPVLRLGVGHFRRWESPAPRFSPERG